jgi:hypothetical protein
MIMRLAEALELGPSRRADLFEAAGYTSPYKRRPASDSSVGEAMQTVERYILGNWPYPALAMTPVWDVIAANRQARALFGFPEGTSGGVPNLFDVLLSPDFRGSIGNWSEVGAVIYSRLRLHAGERPEFRDRLDKAVADGAFGGLLLPLAETEEIPVILPIAFDFSTGMRFRMTSLTARFTSAHDESLSGLEIELCLPLDDESDTFLRAP